MNKNFFKQKCSLESSRVTFIIVSQRIFNNYVPEGLCPGIKENFHFEKGSFPVAEKLQPQMMQFKCNYRNMEDAKKNANILRNTWKNIEEQ